jgi:type II secretory pathway pseudopilin PulG
MSATRARRGRSALEVIVAVVLIGFILLYLLLAMPRGREAARRATCQRNLMQIGMALSLYHQSATHLPTARLGGESPLAAMLGELGLVDFMTLSDRKVAPRKTPAGPAAERPVRGFICPSDRNATAGIHPAPVSYRANTGDTVDGLHGPFALGRKVTLEEVEAADGTSYTAAFSERFVGDGKGSQDDIGSYTLAPGPVPKDGCPSAGPTSWGGDAGSSWLLTDWRSTLYSHIATPNAPRSCISSDGLTAIMGASSGHAEGVHVLLLDGSLKTYRTSVSPEVWRALSTIGEPGR